MDAHPMHLHLVAYEVIEKGVVDGYLPANAASKTAASFTAMHPDTDPGGNTLAGNPAAFDHS
jgi:hypothetical protein